MRFRVTCRGRFEAASGSIDDDALKALHTAMTELNRIGQAAGNAAAHLDRETGSITISCSVEADKLSVASQPASDAIYLSLNNAGIGTPDWPKPEDPVWKVELTRTESEQLQTVGV